MALDTTKEVPLTIPTLSFDWNCAISVENREASANAVEALVAAHRAGVVEVAVLAVSASENTRKKGFPPNAIVFRERLERLGWDDLPVVPAPAVADLTFFDNDSLYVGDAEAYETLVARLWGLLAGEVPRDPRACLAPEEDLGKFIHSERLHKWRNRWCDVHSAWSHIMAGRDIFVTTNKKDFQRNAKALQEMGLQMAATPDEALGRLGFSTPVIRSRAGA